MNPSNRSSDALHDFSQWSFIPGPESNPPSTSLELHDLVEYPPEVISQAFLAYPGMRLVHSAEPEWWDWQARWQQGDRFLELDMTLMEDEALCWGGSGITSRCTLDDLMRLWHAVRETCPAVWLHNGLCEIHTPESFPGRIAGDEASQKP